MNQSLRSHPERPQEEVDSLLAQLPSGMQDKVALIRSHVRHMTPAGLNSFIEILRQEVKIIMTGENSYEKRIALILQSASDNFAPAANDQ